ncbi:sensor histidine kinase [Stenotrophomonas mori]|uniref:histidine kinase n=1 Tax=Stenotrophomonas mori TaxID=2871096 RepID=A0ABT0SI40_9GAMM|nr:ATP-binding protein [Stenotrophomonas mori]MCL7714989.1 GHKL domain-containing protein [Stenotrophomonas mori]
MSPSQRMPLVLRLALIATVMAVIFVVDTTTRYEVAAAVFYTVVVLTAVRLVGRTALLLLCAACIVLTVASLVLTPHGDLRSGLVNMGISIAAIVMTTWLALKMEAARAAAHEAQAQLLRITRITSLEGLTTSIAHEVNQPLAAIVTSGNACQRWLAQDAPNLERARQALERILADAGRASGIIARVRSLTRGEPPQRAPFDLDEAVREVVELSQANIAMHHIVLSLELAGTLPPALADRVQVQQVVGNLLLNAIEALLPVAPAARRLRLASCSEDGMLLLCVEDTGVGLAPGMIDHLFDAFWTSKDEGIGVGLSISRAIVEANGGRIWAEPGARGGAVFRFTLPVADGEAAA